MTNALEWILSLTLLLWIAIWVYTKMKKQTLKDTWEDFKNGFPKTEEVD
jgi:hypothetical protein